MTGVRCYISLPLAHHTLALPRSCAVLRGACRAASSSSSVSAARRPTVLFCGLDFKPWIASIKALKPHWNCIAVPRKDVPAVLASQKVDVAVPLMTRLSREDIAAVMMPCHAHQVR